MSLRAKGRRLTAGILIQCQGDSHSGEWRVVCRGRIVANGSLAECRKRAFRLLQRVS